MEQIPTNQGARPVHAAASVTTAVILIFVAVYFARPVLFPAVLALVVSFALRPVVRGLRLLRIPAFGGALIVVASVLAIVGGGIYALSEPAGEWLDRAPNFIETVELKLRPVQDSVTQIGTAVDRVENMANNIEDKKTPQVQIAQPTVSNVVLGATSESLLQIGLTVSLLFVLLAFNDQLISSFARLGRTAREKINIREVFIDIERMISRYLLYYSLINIGLGITIGLGLWLMGMPNSLLWGTMAALLNFIPVIGLTIGTIVVFLVALISFDSAIYALIAPAIYLTANLFEANVVTPSLLGKTMQINTVFLYGALVVWGFLWGVGGVLIAVPLMAAFKIVSDHFEVLSPVSALLSNEDGLSISEEQLAQLENPLHMESPPLE